MSSCVRKDYSWQQFVQQLLAYRDAEQIFAKGSLCERNSTLECQATSI